MLLMLDPRSQS